MDKKLAHYRDVNCVDWDRAVELRDGALFFRYDPDQSRTWNSRWAGKRVGRTNHCGYRIFNYGGKQYTEHRVIYAMACGRLEQWEQIDHIDCNKSNNNPSNLRKATIQQNSANVLVRNRIGLKGVYKPKQTKRFKAVICKNRKQIHLGFFDTPEEAHKAYSDAASRLFGEFARIA